MSEGRLNVLRLKESTRESPGEFICECGAKVNFTMHHDFVESECKWCGKKYCVKVGEDIWNCCKLPLNPPSIEDKSHEISFTDDSD
jgi:hypothetical protein